MSRSMDDMADDPFSAASLVKQFSWEVENNSPTIDQNEYDEELNLTLVEETRRKQREAEEHIRRIEEHYNSTRPNDEKVFQNMQDKLRETMKQFQSLTQTRTDSSLGPMTWAQVQLVVSDIQATWTEKEQNGRMARVRAGFRKLCEGIQNHSAALEMLPSENDYVSIISGCITMILKASANYVKIVTSFTDGIGEINDAVCAMRQGMAIHQTPALKQLVMRFYTHVFSYLNRFITWFTDRSRKRFLHSFNENLNDIFRQDLDSINKISSLVVRHMNIRVAVDTNASRFFSEAAYTNTHFLLDLHESQVRDTKIRESAQADLFQQVLRESFTKSNAEIAESLRNIMGEYMESVRRRVAGEAIRELLESQASKELLPPGDKFTIEGDSPGNLTPRSETLIGQIQAGEGQLQSSGVQGNELVPKSPKLSRQRGQDIQLWSARFEDFFDREHCFPISTHSHHLLTDSNFVASLKRFTLSMESQVLYVHGDYQDQDNDIVRYTALQYVSLCRDSKIAVVSHFCSLSHNDPPPNRTRETVELTALLYSLIRQVIDLMPVMMPIGHEFDKAEFDELDGTLRTWDRALALFRHLVLSVQLPVMVFVIDRLNELEIGNAQAQMSKRVGELVECLTLLRDDITRRGQIVKLLFTTAGISPCLVDRIDLQDTVCYTTPSARRGRRQGNATERLPW